MNEKSPHFGGKIGVFWEQTETNRGVKESPNCRNIVRFTDITGDAVCRVGICEERLVRDPDFASLVAASRFGFVLVPCTSLRMTRTVLPISREAT